MRYIQIADDKWIRTDDQDKAVVLSVAVLQSNLSRINQRLSELPPDPTDDELLAWAKINYPAMFYGAEREYLVLSKNEIETDLSNMGQ